MKKYLKVGTIAMASLMAVSMTACSTKPTTEPTETVEDKKGKEESTKEKVYASDKEVSWFNTALTEYINSEFTGKYYVKTSVYDALSGMSAKTALKNTNASIIMCVDASETDDAKASEFAETIVRKLASDQAAGAIEFTIHRIPNDLYVQILDSNYNTIIKEAASSEDYAKYSSKWKGTGIPVQEESKPSADQKSEETTETTEGEEETTENTTDTETTVDSEEETETSTEIEESGEETEEEPSDSETTEVEE